MANIGFIGTGEIAAAMVRGLTGHGHSLFLSNRNASIAAELAALEDVELAENQKVIDHSDIVILCLLKDVALAVVSSLKFRTDQRVISVMVDVSLDQLKNLCSPVQHIEITIPLPFVATGGCPLPCFPTDKIVKQIFGAQNPVFAVATDAGLNAHFAVTAMASVAFAQAETASDWLGALTGDTEASEIYVLAMLGGFFAGLPQDGQKRITQALNALNTEGGLNQTLRKHMKDLGVQEDLKDGLNSFRTRLGLPND
jgi:pyrroline-5-carboxylate reductase